MRARYLACGLAALIGVASISGYAARAKVDTTQIYRPRTTAHHRQLPNVELAKARAAPGILPQRGILAPKPAPTPDPSYPAVIGGGSFQLTAVQVAGYARGAGFPESIISTMVAIAARESGYNAHAVNLSSGACGLWQLYPCPGLSFLDPAVNAAGAYAKYQASGLSPWGF
jgi:hypothetical protein